MGDFYGTVTPEIRNILEYGLGEEIAELFQEKDFKIQELWLIQDGQSTEINPMLGKLLALV